MWETINNVKDGIWLNPKCFNNGYLVANLRNRKVKRLSRKRVKPQAIGGRNGSPLTHNGEGEEII